MPQIEAKSFIFHRVILALSVILILSTYVGLINLKGISSDEGLRLAVINGGQGYRLQEAYAPEATWAGVLAANRSNNYQPFYFLLQNTVMRVAQSHHVLLFRAVNIFFLWVCLQGLLLLSREWMLLPRLFLLGLFAFNAYLMMHVLQVREYILGVAFYIWSTWLVLRLDARRLSRPLADIGWFGLYALLMIVGFYTQAWVVFPVVGQCVFLLLRRREDRRRFWAWLAGTYCLVIAATAPYLLMHPQKVDVGRWGSTTSRLMPQLSTGFHLVLSGHLPGHSAITDFLFWLWLAVIAAGALPFLSRRFRARPELASGDYARQTSLMLLCSGAALAFQVGYFFKVEDLSLWPRYFVIHYFFLFWLVALCVRLLLDLRASLSSAWFRRGLAVVTAGLAAVAAWSGVYQTKSYFADPFLDTSLNRSSNWLTVAQGIERYLQPGDVLVVHDFITRATVSFSRGLTCPFVLLDELEKHDFRSAHRMVYLETINSVQERDAVMPRLAALGFSHPRQIRLQNAEGTDVLPEWWILVLSRQ